MLEMKHTWKAVMTLGLALLLGPGLAMAQAEHRLDGLTPDGPLVYAQETLGMADNRGRRALELPADGRDILVAPRRAIAAGEDVYVRIDLTGAVFGAATPLLVTGTTGSLTAADATQLSSGGPNMSFAVIQLPSATSIAAGSATPGGLIGVRIPDGPATGDAAADDILVTSGSTSVSVAIAAYTDPDDALDQTGARSTFGGSGTLVRLMSGLSVTIASAPRAVADVDAGFTRFVGGAGQARLGWLGVQENIDDMDDLVVLHAGTGGPLVRGDILDADVTTDPENPVITGQINFNVSGNLNIGAFRLIPENDDYVAVTDTGGATCPAVGEGAVDRGNLVDAMNMPLIGEEGELPSAVESANSGAKAPDVYLLCLNVDVMGPMSSMMAIPEAAFTATAHIDPDGNPNTADGEMVGEGAVGTIRRNGASVQLPYLTTSTKHNQRLIIVNRGASDVTIRDISFTAENGVDVELTSDIQMALDSGTLVVPAQSSWTEGMNNLIEISGRGPMRTAATIAFAATAGNLSVATTQVNLGDSSTDTVVYQVTGL